VLVAEKADSSNLGHVAAPFQGVVTLKTVVGTRVELGQAVASIEAMKMETTVRAECAATIEAVLILAGAQVEGQDLVVRLVKSS
jgi:pyruvate carboxylase